ncbi:uncharacterized protein LOC129578868 isoform X2 [Sitodiplosis mosellana]|uniref:uncharacterized protein LOC129578868 isoform X2 n=1 Tax=Sitodiplosis mosellana TaxID=263140 RepID=UPI002443E55E|nr:uncharacterized protein LOC129578868 isoform X2 [Sitodiplosis mosellana]
MKFTVVAIFACFLILPIKCSRINSKVYEELLMENQNHIIDVGGDSGEQTQDQLQEQPPPPRVQQKNKECMQRLNILKCMKIFILQRMERSPIYPNTGNVTADFLDQILTFNQNNSEDGSINEETLDKYYLQMSEVEINERLLKSFQRFFHDREIKLHFIPGMVVKVVPNEENAINLSLKRASTWLEATGRAKNRPGDYLLQLGIPAILMPAILMGSVLPFILPALKFATIFSGMINHAALVSAFAYAAKHAAFPGPESIKHLYYNPGYHRRTESYEHQ